ncbi:MAG: hypothetical protein V1820_01145 [archaeon]
MAFEPTVLPTGAEMATLLAALGIFTVFIIILALAGYIYGSITLMTVARKTKTPRPWLAWIPYGNLYLTSQIAKMSGVPAFVFAGGNLLLAGGATLAFFSLLNGLANPNVLLLIGGGFAILAGIILSLIGTVFMYIWMWKICVIRGRPGWWALVPLAALPAMVLSALPIIGNLLANLVNFVASIWTFVMWGILAWADVPGTKGRK